MANVPIPTYKQPIVDQSGNTTRPWYFYFQYLANKIASVTGLTATGVNPAAYTNANITVNQYGQVTAASNGTGGGGAGTVTSVGLSSTDFTISGSPVTTAGSITANLNTQSGVTAGTYSPASVTVNAKGVVTGISTSLVSGTNITPDTHPTELPVNDEFEQTGSAIDTTGSRFTGATAWTAFNSSGAGTLQQQGSLYLTLPLNSGRNFTGFSQPISGATWTYTTKFNAISQNTYTLQGIALATASGASGPITIWGLNGGTFTVQNLTNATTFYNNAYTSAQGPITTAAVGPLWSYLQIAFDGTNLVFGASSTGLIGSFVPQYTATAASFLGTPTLVILGGDNESPTVQAVGAYDWFRKTA